MKFKHYVSITKLSAVVIYEKAVQLASASGVLLKDYISDPENIRHMSLILYDLLPLSIKITLRHETFHKYLTSLIKKMQEPLVIEEPKHTASVLTNEYPKILKGRKLEQLTLPPQLAKSLKESKPLTGEIKPSDLKAVHAKLKKEREGKKLQEQLPTLTNNYPSILNGEKLEVTPLPTDFDVNAHKEVAEGTRVIKATSLEDMNELIKKTQSKKALAFRIPTEEEDAAISAAAWADPDSKPFSDEEWAKVKVTKRPTKKVTKKLIPKESKE